MNLVLDDPWTGSLDALPSPDLASRQLPAILSGGLRDTYAGVLSEGIPDDLTRGLRRLAAEREGLAAETPPAPDSLKGS